MKFKVILNQQTPEVIHLQEEDIPCFIKENKTILLNFMKFARSKSKVAVGLAANQLSLDKERMMLPVIAVKWNHQWTLAIEPSIISTSGDKVSLIETCLTWPGKKLKVNRHFGIVVGYYDLTGAYRVKECFELHAQIWQHEIDHINGTEEIFYE